MLRHIGKRRSFDHNLKLAILFCLNAGFINAAGILAFAVLTTNVTGHAALMAVNIAAGQWRVARIAALWLFLFFSGAFISSSIIRRTGRSRPFAYTLPIVMIMVILVPVIVKGDSARESFELTEFFAGCLLFAMGAQNAIVSMISGSVVRTTHLTGMVTDLGIDLSHALFKNTEPDKQLRRRLLLRGAIIVFFLIGGISGAILFVEFGFYSFIIPVFILLIALLFDYTRMRIRLMLRDHH